MAAMEGNFKTDKEPLLSLLREYLSYPLNDGEEIFKAFAALPEAISAKGTHPMERFVYVPGSRKDRVLLVAHADTVWDRNYDRPQPKAEPVFQEDRVIGGTQEAGLGADDRAGCALLWYFRNMGHSLLLLDGEEKGHFAAKYLSHNHKKLLREMNRHCYILALDYPGGRICHYHGVHNSRGFTQFVEQTLGCQAVTQKKGSDLPYLCRGACGVNIGIGYHSAHTCEEYLYLPQFFDTAERLEMLLPLPQRAYRTRKLPRLRDHTIKELKKLWAFIRKRILKK